MATDKNSSPSTVYTLTQRRRVLALREASDLLDGTHDTGGLKSLARFIIEAY